MRPHEQQQPAAAGRSTVSSPPSELRVPIPRIIYEQQRWVGVLTKLGEPSLWPTSQFEFTLRSCGRQHAGNREAMSVSQKVWRCGSRW
jgi:hypothetical protein